MYAHIKREGMGLGVQGYDGDLELPDVIKKLLLVRVRLLHQLLR